MSGIMKTRTSLRIVGGVIFSSEFAADAVNAALVWSAPTAAYIAKTDESGGWMRFDGREADRCNGRCAQDADTQCVSKGLYGLAVADMCRATDAWVAAQAVG